MGTLEMGFTKEFNRLVTEERNDKTLDLDLLDTTELVKRVQSEDFAVAEAVGKVTPQIGEAVDIIVSKLKDGGRMIYFGAGTSGRLGVLDATECSPTFGVDFDQVQAFIAGGKEAMFKSFESAEDSIQMGVTDAQAANITSKDVVVGYHSQWTDALCRWCFANRQGGWSGDYRSYKQHRRIVKILRCDHCCNYRPGSFNWINQNESW